MENLLPDDTLYRKKMGFSVPLASWLKNEIATIARDKLLINNEGLCQFFKTDEVKKMWEQHQNGSRDYSNELWSMLVFQLWWDRYIL